MVMAIKAFKKKGLLSPWFYNPLKFVELRNGIHLIIEVASPGIQKRPLIPPTGSFHVCFADARHKLTIIRHNGIQPRATLRGKI